MLLVQVMVQQLISAIACMVIEERRLGIFVDSMHERSVEAMIYTKFYSWTLQACLQNMNAGSESQQRCQQAGHPGYRRGPCHSPRALPGPTVCWPRKSRRGHLP